MSNRIDALDAALWQAARTTMTAAQRERLEATKRNFVNIERRVVGLEKDGQSLQQFMSDSPWSAHAVFDQIQAEIQQRPELASGMLTLDESGKKCAGDQKAGAGRQ